MASYRGRERSTNIQDRRAYSPINMGKLFPYGAPIPFVPNVSMGYSEEEKMAYDYERMYAKNEMSDPLAAMRGAPATMPISTKNIGTGNGREKNAPGSVNSYVAPFYKFAPGEVRTLRGGPGFLSGSGGNDTLKGGNNLPPEAAALLDAISGPESKGKYNIRFGGAHFDDFSDHPRVGKTITSGPNKGQVSTAAGRYQITKTTWDNVIQPALNLPDFSPESQDIAAWYLAQQDYRRKAGSDLLTDLRSGDPAVIAQVGKKLSGTWTSLPGGIEQGTSTNRFVSAFNTALQRRAEPVSPTVPPRPVREASGTAIAAIDNALGIPPAVASAYADPRVAMPPGSFPRAPQTLSGQGGTDSFGSGPMRDRLPLPAPAPMTGYIPRVPGDPRVAMLPGSMPAGTLSGSGGNDTFPSGPGRDRMGTTSPRAPNLYDELQRVAENYVPTAQRPRVTGEGLNVNVRPSVTVDPATGYPVSSQNAPSQNLQAALENSSSMALARERERMRQEGPPVPRPSNVMAPELPTGFNRSLDTSNLIDPARMGNSGDTFSPQYREAVAIPRNNTVAALPPPPVPTIVARDETYPIDPRFERPPGRMPVAPRTRKPVVPYEGPMPVNEGYAESLPPLPPPAPLTPPPVRVAEVPRKPWATPFGYAPDQTRLIPGTAGLPAPGDNIRKPVGGSMVANIPQVPPLPRPRPVGIPQMQAADVPMPRRRPPGGPLDPSQTFEMNGDPVDMLNNTPGLKLAGQINEGQRPFLAGLMKAFPGLFGLGDERPKVATMRDTWFPRAPRRFGDGGLLNMLRRPSNGGVVPLAAPMNQSQYIGQNGQPLTQSQAMNPQYNPTNYGDAHAAWIDDPWAAHNGGGPRGGSSLS